ncbi:MAG: hypothetical protein LBK45_06900, partial [Tannerellaceae bacterium]|nr:hypothetical protein [Tannerellaceae bacterium]
MKKSFFFSLLVMAFSITFFSACGDDKKDDGGVTPTPNPPTPTPVATTWKDALGGYKAGDASTVLKLNGENTEETTKLVTLATGSGDNAKITLTNLVPDDATVEFDDVVMTKSGDDYTFSSEKTVGTTTITISGTLSGVPATKADAVKTLDIKTVRKIDSPIAGIWSLNLSERGADVFFDVSSGDPATDAAFAQLLGPAFGGMLAQKVTAVTATFTEDGLFDVTWMKPGETEPTGMPDAVKKMVSLLYYASEGQVFIALAKKTLPMLEVLASAQNLDMTTLLAAMIDKGDFVALPLNIKLVESAVSFFMEKEMVGVALPMILPMMGGLGEQMP